GDAGGPSSDASVGPPSDRPTGAIVPDGPLGSGVDASVAGPPGDAPIAVSPPDAPAASPPPDGAVASSCPSTGTLFASDFLPVTADSDFLYGWGLSSIVRVGRGGGTPELVVSDVDTVRALDLIVDDTSVYWSFRADEGGGKIFRAPRSGGP